MANQQYLSCPDCGSQIPFDPYALLTGASFSCPECPSVSIGLDRGSWGVVNKSLNEFEKLKQTVGKNDSDELSFF
jgi:predicted RNA-binding Zn-ribbon protein involved in translation (DUF1610 family)